LKGQAAADSQSGRTMNASINAISSELKRKGTRWRPAYYLSLLGLLFALHTRRLHADE
jgi:hypothetical protein